MGCWYWISGEVKVKDTKKTRAIVNQLTKMHTGDVSISIDDNDDKTFNLRIDGGEHTSYVALITFEEKLVSLGPFVVDKAACFGTICDDEAGELWVGTAAQIKEGIREAKLQKARKAIRALDADQVEQLIKDMQTPDFYRDD